MKPVFLFFILFLNNIVYSQQKIVHLIDKQDRLKSTQYPDSLILKRTFDNVGNIISEVIVNPCFDRPNPFVTTLGSLSICQGDSIKLTAPVSLSYKWSTGDTSRSIIVKIAGTYNVTTFNTLNCSKTSLPVTVVVNSLPEPEIDTSSSTTFCYGYNTILTSHLTGSYLWNTGDTTRSIIADTSKTYTLTFTDSNGCSASISKQVLLFPQPHANFTINDTGQCINGNSYVFSNSSTISSGTMNNFWRFGDGSISSVLSPTKTYTSNGSYRVTLISTSNDGCIDSISKYITVYPKPTPSFSLNGSVLCAKSSIVFSNSTTLSQGTLSFVWEFGDGTYSNISSPTKTYNVGGVYNVKLIAISDKGCTVIQSVMIIKKINSKCLCATNH